MYDVSNEGQLVCRCLLEHLKFYTEYIHIDGLVEDCSNSIANALELLQSCTKPLISFDMVCNKSLDTNIWWDDSDLSVFSPGLILGLRPANERRRYQVTLSLIGWAQTSAL